MGKINAPLNTLISDKNFTVLMPWLGFFCRPRDGIENALFSLGVGQDLCRPRRIDSFSSHLFYNGLQLGSIQIVSLRGMHKGNQQRGHQNDPKPTCCEVLHRFS